MPTIAMETSKMNLKKLRIKGKTEKEIMLEGIILKQEVIKYQHN
jgi:hypothetical protein